jgi:hypothetical protein
MDANCPTCGEPLSYEPEGDPATEPAYLRHFMYCEAGCELSEDEARPDYWEDY